MIITLEQSISTSGLARSNRHPGVTSAQNSGSMMAPWDEAVSVRREGETDSGKDPLCREHTYQFAG